MNIKGYAKNISSKNSQYSDVQGCLIKFPGVYLFDEQITSLPRI